MDEFEKNDALNSNDNTRDVQEITAQPEQPEKAPFNVKKEILDWTFSIVIAIIAALVIRTYIFTLVKVDGPSMNPTLTHGDVLYTNRFMYKPSVGDIIIFRPPNSPKTPYVKRVIAVAGQTVDIDGESHTVTVDGKVLDEDYIKEPLMSAGTMEYPVEIPEGYIFVMGDNRNNSRDSRDATVGLVPVDNVIGKAEFRILPLKSIGSLY